MLKRKRNLALYTNRIVGNRVIALLLAILIPALNAVKERTKHVNTCQPTVARLGWMKNSTIESVKIPLNSYHIKWFSPIDFIVAFCYNDKYWKFKKKYWYFKKSGLNRWSHVLVTPFFREIVMKKIVVLVSWVRIRLKE